jgi:guanine deaminase
MSPNQFLIPGLIDTHIHAPQYVFTGTGYDRTLLDWLNTYTFPREAEFSSEQIARDSYTKAVDRSLKSGTTTACYYGTIHVEATKKLADIITTFGQRAFIGKVNMDANSPDFYIERNAQESLNATKAVIDYIQSLKNPLITPVITPRFVPSCTSALMMELGKLAKSKNLPIQSHLSETPSEIQWVKELFPKSASYSEIYDDHGLLTNQTIMAHCVHLSKQERELLLDRQVGISHCPASNFCLSSGVLNVKRLFNEGYSKIGLGTDVAGGYSPSILESIRQAMTASKVVHIQSRDSETMTEPLSLAEAFYMATLGGASVLNLESKIGNFAVGKNLDAILVDMDSSRPIHTFDHDTLADKFEKFIYLGDDRHMLDIFVNGHSVLNRES